MSSQQNNEDVIRQAMVQHDVVDCMVALPGQLFYSTQIPACLWFLARSKAPNGFRDRRGEVLFIDARKLSRPVEGSRTQRELTEDEISRVAGIYHAWRGKTGEYADVPGFCRAVTKEEIEKAGWVLTPGRYVGAAEANRESEAFEGTMARLAATLRSQLAEDARLDALIRQQLARVGHAV